jgi:hypothetical protein
MPFDCFYFENARLPALLRALCAVVETTAAPTPIVFQVRDLKDAAPTPPAIGHDDATMPSS